MSFLMVLGIDTVHFISVTTQHSNLKEAHNLEANTNVVAAGALIPQWRPAFLHCEWRSLKNYNL